MNARWLQVGGAVVLGVGLLMSLYMNLNQAITRADENTSILNDGIIAAKGGLYVAMDIFDGGIMQKAKHLGMTDAAVCVGQAAGALAVIHTAAHDAGVDHLTGISMELQQVSFRLSHPQHFANSIKADEAFVKTVWVDLDSSFPNGHLDKVLLNRAIAKIYAAMPAQDSKILYGAN